MYTKISYRTNLIRYWQRLYPNWEIPAGYIVHHIKPKCTFDDPDDSRMHHPRNLIALHPDDHVSIHKCRGDNIVAENFLLVSGKRNHRGKNNPMYNRTQTEKTRLSISKSQSNNIRSASHSNNISKALTGNMSGDKNPNFGNKYSEETCQAIAKSRTGTKWFNNGIIEKPFKEGTVTEGFILGRLKRELNKCN